MVKTKTGKVVQVKINRVKRRRSGAVRGRVDSTPDLVSNTVTVNREREKIRTVK